jgi:inosine-uridine nucleoside N-ribohydrolase
MEKILLDTDIGSDIDDAVCLAYLLSQKKCDLLGITTVAGEANRRAMIASSLCKIAKKDVPIYPGVEKPLLTEGRQTTAPQADRLAHWEHDTKFPQNQAVAFLQDTIRRNPHEVTLLSIGQMTNLALLFATDPEIPRLLKRHVAMCGVFTTRLPGLPRVEWNALCDPYAAAIVYNAPVPVCRSVGLDVTCQIVIPKEEVKKRFTADILQPVLDFADVWFQNEPSITFHDPLAGVSIFDESVCAFTRGNVSVELESEKLRGFTFWEEDPEGAHEVALEVDKEQFLKEYFTTVK